jgi:hypothetical protein
MLAGHSADAVTWLSDNLDGWTTSTAFASAPVPEVGAYVAAHPIEAEMVPAEMPNKASPNAIDAETLSMQRRFILSLRTCGACPQADPPHPTTLDVHHSKVGLPMSESGQSEKSGRSTGRSALPPTADVAFHRAN